MQQMLPPFGGDELRDHHRDEVVVAFAIKALDVAQQRPCQLAVRRLQHHEFDACASPKLDSPAFSTASLVILPTTVFQIEIRT